MSLWRVRHRLSPVVEKSLVALVGLAGVASIYFASIQPFVVATTADIRSMPEQLSLDTDAWGRGRNMALGYQYGVPPGWIVVGGNPARVTIARAPGFLKGRGPAGSVIVIETAVLGPRQQVENLAAEEFAGTRPALYDVAVDGHPGLFAVTFDNGRPGRQAVYAERRPGDELVIHGDGMDLPAFSTFISTVKFFTPSL